MLRQKRTNPLNKYSNNFRNEIWFVLLILLISSQSVKAFPASIETADGENVPGRQTTSSAPVRFCTIPFSCWERNGNPIIHVRINDKLDADFLLDTGSEMSIIRSDLVRKLKIKPQSRDVYDLISHKRQSVDCVTIDKIDVGAGLIMSGFLDINDAIPDVPHARRIDGIIGGNMFFQTAIEFDFDRQTLEIFEAGNLKQGQLSDLGFPVGKAVAIPTTNDPIHIARICIPVTVLGSNGEVQRQLLEIDTGGSVTALPPGAAKPKSEPLFRYYLGSVDGLLNEEAYPVSAISVGSSAGPSSSFALSPFVCNFLQPGRQEDLYQILSMDYLSHFRILLDYPAHMAYFLPITLDKAILFPTDASRMNAIRLQNDVVVRPTETGQWNILALVNDEPRSFRAAGARVGDFFTEIDGVHTDGISPTLIASLLKRIETKSVTIDLRRDSKPIAIMVQSNSPSQRGQTQ